MCGICGFMSPPLPEDEQIVGTMADALAHRGPDGRGVAALRSADGAHRGWFGHRRLRIIDLSECAAQPMAAPDVPVVLTYNGEIYNFRELRRELEARGHRFTSSGDTQVVLRAYVEWGESFVARLRGMFALAIWDGRADALLLARDPVGKKPLYVWRGEDRFVFGSEIKALLRAPWVPAEPDLDQVPEYLALGYVPEPRTFYRHIDAVEPGSLLRWNRGTGAVIRRYWTLPDPEPGLVAAERIRAALHEAVRQRLVADVPVGAFLSGGIDSSVVVALMQRELAGQAQVRTFSAGFREPPSWDERGPAERVARALGTQHTSFEIRADAVELLDTLVDHHDQPFGDSSAIPTYLLARAAREHATVVLTGDGGDEIFAGYDRFKAARLDRAVPRPAIRALGSAARALPRSDHYRGARGRLVRYAVGAERPLAERYAGWVALASPDVVAGLTHGSPWDLPPSLATALEQHPGDDELDAILRLNFTTYLPGDLLPKVDRMSMASSLEVRCPLLDRDLVDLVMRQPAGPRIGWRAVKPQLRAAVGDLVPAEVWTRPKHGFGVPVGVWFRGELREAFVDEVLARDARSRPMIDEAALTRVWQDHQDGTRDHANLLWSVLTLERWLRTR